MSAAPPLLLSREQAILSFNARVLAQAQRSDVPLLERLRYITIVSSNLDEFFEVRVADMIENSGRAGSGVTRADWAAVVQSAHELIDAQYTVFNDVVMPALAAAGIVVLNHAQRDRAQRMWVREYFETQVRPLLVPLSLDPSHPFPQVANKSLNFIVRLGGHDAFGRDNPIAIVKVPRALPRVIRLPASLSAGRQVFVLLTSVIRAHLAELFASRRVVSFSQFRVTRDSDLDVDPDDISNLRQALRRGLSTRQFGRALRLEVVKSCPADLHDFLLQHFNLPDVALYKVNGPVNLVRLNQLIDAADGAALRFPPFEPCWPLRQLPRDASVLAQLSQRDVLLHHPFDSFDPVIQFLQEAVHDPQVLAIKQTVYRTGAQSVLMDLLIEAVRRGKEVLAVVELKARFDEEANINWAERLEAVGAQVVYGVVGLKTHAKMLLVTRREGATLHRFLHLSTGNYNPRTARLYTDVGLLTADPALTADADALFLQLASQLSAHKSRQLLTAPFVMHKALLQSIDKVAQASRAGLPGRIVVKVNALTDGALIKALLRASQSGSRIDLVVRGACMLAPGVPGQSDNITVRSVVGRFLEHTRVAYFSWGPGPDDEALYLSSADWMSRNMFGRIELAWPVRHREQRQRVIDECLVPYLHDGRDAWTMDRHGAYWPAQPPGYSAQQALLHDRPAA
jgi:polyphosphate kinase